MHHCGLQVPTAAKADNHDNVEIVKLTSRRPEENGELAELAFRPYFQ